MRGFLSISFFILSGQIMGQNIVPNGGFEYILNCPTGGGAVFWATPWRSSANSPDLYNECGSNGYSVPLNINGLQLPHQGEGYVGIASYVNHPSFVDAREFLKCTLNYALIENEQYYVEFYASQGDSAEYATHNLGVTFTDVVTDTGEFGELLCWPDCEIYLENTSANPLTSKTEWMKVSGTFTALGGERYMHIGNFRTDSNSEIEFVGGGIGPQYDWFLAYYYIDDVWLSHVDSAHYVGINEELGIKNYGFDVFPNPSAGVSVTVNYNLPGGDVAELRVFDMSGRQVYRNSNVCGTNAVRLEGLSEGLYHCVLIVNGKTTLSEKLVILRE